MNTETILLVHDFNVQGAPPVALNRVNYTILLTLTKWYAKLLDFAARKCDDKKVESREGEALLHPA
jgi:hypothetical protein